MSCSPKVSSHPIYLGANIEKVELPNGQSEWGMTSRTYVKNAEKIAELLLLEDGDDSRLRTTARNPFPSGYRLHLHHTERKTTHTMQINNYASCYPPLRGQKQQLLLLMIK
jgi:hypothetical protein